MRPLLIAAAAALAMAGTAHAQVDAKKAEAIAKEACGKCHIMEKKRKGPSYKDIAAKAKADKVTADKMVANLKADKDHEIKISDDDLKLVANWILTL
jgi:cytochrome c